VYNFIKDHSSSEFADKFKAEDMLFLV
jgi:hypothetical protein